MFGSHISRIKESHEEMMGRLSDVFQRELRKVDIQAYKELEDDMEDLQSQYEKLKKDYKELEDEFYKFKKSYGR